MASNSKTKGSRILESVLMCFLDDFHPSNVSYRSEFQIVWHIWDNQSCKSVRVAHGTCARCMISEPIVEVEI